MPIRITNNNDFISKLGSHFHFHNSLLPLNKSNLEHIENPRNINKKIRKTILGNPLVRFIFAFLLSEGRDDVENDDDIDGADSGDGGRHHDVDITPLPLL